MELGKLTENYGLLKPDRQDFYNVEDFNKNADILDSALKALKDKGISLEEVINSLAKVAKSGDYADLINAPTSLPANGGNADTVDGKHASDFEEYKRFAPIYVGDVFKISEMGTYSCYGGDCTNLPTTDLSWWFVTMTQFRDSGYKEFIARRFNFLEAGQGVYKASEYNNSNGTLLWEKINDGGNADTVDGKHASDFAKANLPTGIPVPLNISGASARWYRLFCFNPIAGGIINFSLAGLHPFNIGASFVVSASWDKTDVNVISYSTNFSSPRVKEIRVGYNYNGDNLHYVDVKLEVTEALVSSGVLFLTIGTDSNVGNKNIDLSKLGSDVDSIIYGNSCAKPINKTFLGYTDLGSVETDVNKILVTGTYKCTNFKNYPKACADGQGILRVENYMTGNASFVSGTMGTDSMWLKQYYTEPFYGKTYERSVSAKSIGAWQLVGDGCNASKFDGFTYDEMYEDIGYKGVIKQKWEGELTLEQNYGTSNLFSGSVSLSGFNAEKCLAMASVFQSAISIKRFYYYFDNKNNMLCFEVDTSAESGETHIITVDAKVIEFY